MSKTPQDKKREPAAKPSIKPGIRPGTKKSAPRSDHKLVTVIVVTAFIATVVSASAVLLLQRVFSADPAATAQIVPPDAPPALVQPKPGQTFVYYDFPKLSVFLKRTNSRQPALANIRVTAEFVDAAPLQVTRSAQPRIMDAMQSFLRECSREELDGRAGTDMLRQAFVQIVNDAIMPHQANTVLFKEIVIQ
jgi:flagellar basal body-associated protein FliL